MYPRLCFYYCFVTKETRAKRELRKASWMTNRGSKGMNKLFAYD